MMNTYPFATENLNRIFRVSSRRSDLIGSQENTWLEFKKNFTWAAREEYARTMAAFANTRGGYLVFGVANKPRKMVGLTDDTFEQLDPAALSEQLESFFSPQPQWEKEIHSFQGMDFGMIYTWPAEKRPVIAMKNGNEKISEGDIYYRYNGRSKRIGYTELNDLIEENRRKEQDYWIQHMRRLEQVGVANAAVLDLDTGVVSGAEGAFLIDESLLPELQFIKEGEFSEREGAPTLKLLGDLQPIEAKTIRKTEVRERPVGIHVQEIVTNFLQQKTVKDPEAYIQEICFQTTAFLPIYYYMSLAGLSRQETIRRVENVKARLQTKKKLVEILHEDRDFAFPIPNTYSESAQKRQYYQEQILNQSLPDVISPTELRYVLKAVRSLEVADIDSEYLLPRLKMWFDDHYYQQEEVDLANDLRQAICHVDRLLNDVSDS